MNKLLLISIAVALAVACVRSKEGIKYASTEEEIPLSIRETDSIVVNTLISRSKTFYNDNLTSADVYDDFLKEAEEISIKNGFVLPLSKIYHIIGVRHRNRSEYGKAIKFAEKALELSKKLDNKSLLANYINMAAVIYRRVDENKRALEMHMEAMDLAETVNDSFQVSIALNGIGNVYLALKRHHASIEYFKKSFNIAVSRGNVLGQAINANNIGEALKLAGELDSALVYFYQSLEYNSQINSKVGQAICYNSIGDAYRLKKDYAQALKYLKRGLVLNQETRDRINVSISYSILGETYLEIYEFKSAIRSCLEGLKIAEEIGSKYQIEACSRLLSEAYEATNSLKESIKYLKKSQIYKDSIFDEENLRHMTVVAFRHEADKVKSQIQQLNKETTLQRKLISQQKRTILYFIFSVLALFAASVLVYRQVKLNAGYKSVLMQQRLLRSQMNPHFIFNALSAIQVYILENDMENSSRFLSEFAKLMRQVLKGSQREYVSLNEEESMLKYYLNLQKLRFDPPFSYDIIIEDNINKEQILIPPMITQPFIENSLEHGIKSMGRQGRVEVRFIKKSDNLIIEIEDNGIGIAESKTLSGIGGNKHESMATRITNDRLEVIKKMSKKSASLKIVDLHENSTSKTGVLVKIEMPIILRSSIN